MACTGTPVRHFPDALGFGKSGFGLRVVIALDAASLVIDAVDVVRFLAGDRAETVAGLGDRQTVQGA